MGPDVNCTGIGEDGDPSLDAHISVTPSRVAWKTKYFPSAVQFPQHFCICELHQDGNSLWRSAPLLEICHREAEPVEVKLSVAVKRKRVPSGDHRMKVATPFGRVVSLSTVLPRCRFDIAHDLYRKRCSVYRVTKSHRDPREHRAASKCHSVAKPPTAGDPSEKSHWWPATASHLEIFPLELATRRKLESRSSVSSGFQGNLGPESRGPFSEPHY